MRKVILGFLLIPLGTILGILLARWHHAEEQRQLLAASDLQWDGPSAARSSHDPDRIVRRPAKARAPSPLPDKVQKLPLIRWEHLLQPGGKPSPKLQGWKSNNVRIPGFVVPLQYDGREATEFLLVPNANACIHVPAPPPDQIVFVKMKGETAPRRENGPVWVYGTLEISQQQTEWGAVAYSLTAYGSLPYEGGYEENE